MRAKSRLTHRKMAIATNYGKSVLAEADRGLRLPTLEVTLAYVRVCGGDVVEWESRWYAARELTSRRQKGGARGCA